jgi:K+-sensing histidine kinase KdpD
MIDQDIERRVRELEDKVIRLTQLAEVSAALNSRVQLDPLLQHIMRVAVEITDCDAASVLLVNRNTQQLFFAASTTSTRADNPLIGKPVPLDSLAGTILRENRSIQVDDAPNDPRWYSKTDEEIDFETRSLLGVPMRYKDRVIGVLEAINKRQLPWTQDDRTYLGILAAQAAVAIEGAQLVTQLKRVNKELSELDQLKNNFIALASHELRTPLGVIMGYASFLQEEESPSAKESATKVLDSALRLRKVIEDMVNLRYLKEKQSDLALQRQTISQFIEHMRNEIMSLQDIGNHKLTISAPVNDIAIKVDADRLMMAINNLLNNAFSFTPQGGSIHIDFHQASSSEIWIRVKDSGAGIAPENLEHIFAEFVQLEDHMTRHHQGLGIGLSIARAIALAHGGRLWAESDGIGHGATFNLAVPIVDSA